MRSGELQIQASALHQSERAERKSFLEEGAVSSFLYPFNNVVSFTGMFFFSLFVIRKED